MSIELYYACLVHVEHKFIFYMSDKIILSHPVSSVFLNAHVNKEKNECGQDILKNIFRSNTSAYL